MLNFDIVAVIK